MDASEERVESGCHYKVFRKLSSVVLSVLSLNASNIRGKLCFYNPLRPVQEVTYKIPLIRCFLLFMFHASYTPWVAKMLGDDYQVQHAPWDRRDGGAKDSKYGLQCLRLFLQTAMLEPTRYDVIIFNFGMHDINYSGNHTDEYITPAEYAKNLRAIKSILLSTGAKVGYVLTTPVPYNASVNDRVIQYNNIARGVMKEYPAVATADLYTWVIEVCGVPPYFHCIIAGRQPSPHYTHSGYAYLSERVKDLVIDLTPRRNESLRFWKRQASFVSILHGASYCTYTTAHIHIIRFN